VTNSFEIGIYRIHFSIINSVKIEPISSSTSNTPMERTMYSYRNNPDYPATDTSAEAMDRAMARGRVLRSKAFHDMAIGFYDWLTTPRRPAVDLASLRNGTTVRASHC
jgi:hypothetical protein